MSIDNLAKVFGPTIVGYSVVTPQPMQMIAETRPQQDVMTALLEHNTDYWTDILSGNHSEVGSLDYDMTDTPECSQRRPGKCPVVLIPVSYENSLQAEIENSRPASIIHTGAFDDLD